MRRSAPTEPARILVAHHLLLGDTLMLTPLLKKLRARYRHADIAMTVARAVAPLYSGRPYGVRALAWDPRRANPALFGEEPFDLAFVPGDNRYAWLAAAMRSRWIVAFADDRPTAKGWPVDAFARYPNLPGAWGDIVATLVEGTPPRYAQADWPAPDAAPFACPTGDYAVLHVGASSPLKQWPWQRWQQLARWLAARGIQPVWSAGPGEEQVVAQCDPGGQFASYAGKLDLAQIFRLLGTARLLVAPDTGVAHLGRVVNVPTVTLFGPGSAVLCGAGEFWRDSPYRAVTIAPFPCRNQRVLFKRQIDWVQRCGRGVAECPQHLCMPAIGVELVTRAIDELLGSS
ncbi:MAG TPA: glycosyltransferase family 9 protein [Casimicrobiaceae bacterium]|nr:glycosyltransferase family 9 protein [Casimicrobiaceae bacterium]